MKKSIILLLAIISPLLSCNNSKNDKKIVKNTTTSNVTIKTIKINKKGYALMKQNCFVCHLEKPNPSKHKQMIAPPMFRVQEHYKPTYPNKNEFVQAIKTWVNNPSEDKVMMPGAVRKFNIMPKLVITNADLQLIAETLYSINFGNMPQTHKEKETKLSLNDGKKW